MKKRDDTLRCHPTKSLDLLGFSYFPKYLSSSPSKPRCDELSDDISDQAFPGGHCMNPHNRTDHSDR